MNLHSGNHIPVEATRFSTGPRPNKETSWAAMSQFPYASSHNRLNELSLALSNIDARESRQPDPCG